MPKIIHYRKKCIGCNSCAQLCPGYWQISQIDGKADLTTAKEKTGIFIRDVRKEEIEINQKAAKACPVKIIHFSE